MIDNFRLLRKIKDGTLDILLTRPVFPQYMAVLRQTDQAIFGITNFPPLFLLHKMPPFCVGWAVLLPILLLTFVRLLQQHGLKSYNSASGCYFFGIFVRQRGI